MHFEITFSHLLYGDIINEYVLDNGIRSISSKIECKNVGSNNIMICINPENLRKIYFDFKEIFNKGDMLTAEEFKL